MSDSLQPLAARLAEAERQRDEALRVLRSIANEDYRGNRSAASQTAHAFLADVRMTPADERMEPWTNPATTAPTRRTNSTPSPKQPSSPTDPSMSRLSSSTSGRTPLPTEPLQGDLAGSNEAEQ